MALARLVLSTLFLSCLVVMTTAVSLSAQPAPDRCSRHGHGAMGQGAMGMFSPEQRMMMFADAQKATADGSLDMQDYRALQRDKLRAMSADQRQAYFTDLTKRYNALSPAEQKKLKDGALAWRKDHPMPDRAAVGGSDCKPADKG